MTSSMISPSGTSSTIGSGNSSLPSLMMATSASGAKPTSCRSLILISCGNLLPGRMMATVQPMVPSFLTQTALPTSMNWIAVSPQYLMWPAWNFWVRFRLPVSFPLKTTKQPFAPASIMFRRDECPARRKYQPRSRALASLLAIT